MTFEQSSVWFERARAVTPGGAQTGSKAPGRVGPLGAFPLYLEHGNGAFVTDVDRQQYIDLFNGNCAVTLGHGHEGVTRAVGHALKSGSLLSLPTRLEVEVAEQLVEALPAGLDQVRFLKTGSEACAAAVRIARMATGRSLILTVPSGYHGWHDWFQVVRPEHPGIPQFYADGVRTFAYNDLDAVDALLNTYQGQVAAVMLEPTLIDAPAPGFLQGLRDRCSRAGALLIFDEMICGARWALGGGSEFFGVTPDLATYGKAFANGLPLAFVAGRADVMAHAWPISGTFGGETVSLAACREVLHCYQMQDAIPQIWKVGQCLMNVLADTVRRLDLPTSVVGYPCRPVLRWDAEEASPLFVAVFQQELAAVGILAHPSGWNPSVAHAPVMLEIAHRVTRALESVSAAYRAGRLDESLRGELIRPAFARATA